MSPEPLVFGGDGSREREHRDLQDDVGEPPLGEWQGGARISNLAQATISHRIYERLSVSASGQYTLSQFFPNTSSQFQFISGTSRLEYKLTRNIRGEIYYLFNHINTNGAQLEYQVSRHQVGFMLSVLLESLGMESLGLESLGQSLGFE